MFFFEIKLAYILNYKLIEDPRDLFSDAYFDTFPVLNSLRNRRVRPSPNELKLNINNDEGNFILNFNKNDRNNEN